MALKSSLKTVAMLGMALSMVSLAAHFFMARYYTVRKSPPEDVYPGFSLRHRVEEVDSSGSHNARMWSTVRSLQSLRPYASPRASNYQVPTLPTVGYLFAEIRGEFHEIRSSICDLIVVARLLNATLVIPRLKEVVSKQISSKFKGFDYIYDEDHFISALADDVPVVKRLPARYQRRRKSSFTVKSPDSAASVQYYLQAVLPVLRKEGVVGISVSGGGCLQSLLPQHLEDHQRLRCRVAFHALRFRKEIQELGSKMVGRLRSSGNPYIAVYLGLERDALAYHGCGERFQDVHTELIQQRRAKMIKSGLIRGELNVDSEKQWLNGSCPLMPDEVSVLLKGLGYKKLARIYVPGVEVFGGQRVLLPLRSMFPNLDDRTTLSTPKERFTVYGEEEDYPPTPPSILPKTDEKARLAAWAKAGPRPRPLPPPAGRPKYSHELEGWWGWVGESAVEPPPTPRDLRIRGHKLLWQALDYIICTEADVFFTAFDEDKSGHPNFASVVMGHRTYASASRRTYRPDRKTIANLLIQVRDHLHDPGREWFAAARNVLVNSMGIEGLITSASRVKPVSFISHPLPECVCRLRRATNSSSLVEGSDGRVLYGNEETCPGWMKNEAVVLEQESDHQQREDGDYEEETSDGATVLAAAAGAGAKSSDESPADKVEETLLTNEPDEDNDPND